MNRICLRPLSSWFLAAALGACGTGDAASDAAGADAASCGTSSAAELVACVDGQRIANDLEVIGHERPSGSAHWQTVADLCAARFEQAGFAVERFNYGSGTNIIGRRQGTDANATDVIVSAHYDSIAGCDGAADDGAGVTAVLEAARLLATSAPAPNNLVVACWDEEERGLIGSSAYAARAADAGTVTSFMMSLETLGYVSSEPNSQTIPNGFDVVFPEAYAAVAANEFRGDFLAVVHDEGSAPAVNAFDTYAHLVGLPVVALKLPAALLLSPLTSDLRRSDHAPFWVHGAPAAMLTDTANFRNPYYHCGSGPDVVANVNLEFLTKTTQVTIGAAYDALRAP